MTRIPLWIILTAFIMVIGNSVNAAVNSVFAEDTCAPPCWFGLIAGQSTSADVENLMAEFTVEDVEVYDVVRNIQLRERKPRLVAISRPLHRIERVHRVRRCPCPNINARDTGIASSVHSVRLE